ncbi:MAG: hypothetical protein R3200_08475, partial [Xanthomonadales bacterium]|nr:hypothetical protein [Xanthomonadales bacterium]
MRNLISELKRRNVFRVALLYVVGSWVILQVADVAVGLMGLPDWTLRFILLILLLGLPVAIAVSWIYELTPEGLKRDREVAPDPARNAETGRKINIVVAGLLVVAIGLFAADRFTPENREASPEAAATPARQDAEPRPEATVATFQPPPRSIAVLPFENMSGAEENAYFSDGLAESLLNLLAR